MIDRVRDPQLLTIDSAWKSTRSTKAHLHLEQPGCFQAGAAFLAVLAVLDAAANIKKL